MKRKRSELTEHGLPLSGFKWEPTLAPRPEPVSFKELADWARLKPLVKRGRVRGKRLSKKEAGERLLRMARELGVIRK